MAANSGYWTKKQIASNSAFLAIALISKREMEIKLKECEGKNAYVAQQSFDGKSYRSMEKDITDVDLKKIGDVGVKVGGILLFPTVEEAEKHTAQQLTRYQYYWGSNTTFRVVDAVPVLLSKLEEAIKDAQKYQTKLEVNFAWLEQHGVDSTGIKEYSDAIIAIGRKRS